MRAEYLPYLADPVSGEPLELQVDEKAGEVVMTGALVSSRARYPIVRGVPRFAGYEEDGAYASSFGYQWNRWKRVQFEAENEGRSMQGHTRRMWERIFGEASVKDRTLAEFGCGPGRFLDIVRSKGGARSGWI